ncbi:acyl-CoA synthetase (AMP-forming)/AMP-acid ligase II [Mycolicibacterium chubuense NBB4]|uniref:Acyl-CoA synthetase (AMP-forming)/AMP-acid ligase II n=1 Tax=Mycolicibacterium chubuense (strain NBB4) TaxID=710421 RepID=I4BK60_MYCCN|nr:fatty acyl-AMP ligase [Mycolicibacterium chubuense]AFM17667.1 acyl-CoA synthetase (AMP-forming)/AMP-acid ligase II [Mycolicibacterium chubuense NBB4]
MSSRTSPERAGGEGLLQIEDCLDAAGDIRVPAGVTFVSLIDRNIANVGDETAYRYLDFSGSAGVEVAEMTWNELGVRMAAIGAHVQRAAAAGDRVAVLAPQGLEYVAGFFAAIKAGAIAVPLFAPELPGHAERLDTALRDARPSTVLTTSAARPAVEAFLDRVPATTRPAVIVIDDIPDSAAEEFAPTVIDVDGISHLQYTGGATRPPVGVEVTHHGVGTNLIQMILSIDLLDRNTHGVSWLPLYHDMGLSMIGFPAVYGGHSTLMSPTAFIRRPQRWIEALSDVSRTGRVVTAAPNFAYEWTAQRGVPAAGSDIDLRNVVLIIGSEPVSMEAIDTFCSAFTPFGLPRTAFKPSYGLAEATLFVATIEPAEEPRAVHLDRARLADGRAVRVAADDPHAVAHVSCGRVARNQWCVIVDPETTAEVPDECVGEIWLQGANIGRGYWGRPEDSERTFGARLGGPLAEGSHTAGAQIDGAWLRSGDLGLYLDGELFVVGRIADVVTVGGRRHHPQDIEATAADASPIVRRGYVAAFSVEGDDGDRLVIIAERAAGTARLDPGPAVDAIAEAVRQRHGAPVSEVRVVPAGAIPRTTSGKLARRACRAAYLSGAFA